METKSQNTELEIISPSSLELMQRAEIDLQVSTAKKYPRDLAMVKKKMISFATLDEETAESCFYTLSRSGKVIQGPSVRLAEIAVACYQNLRAASRVISNDGKTITCQAACHDLENNTLISVEVQRRITDRNGKTYGEDMQIVASNAGNAIAFRNAVFKVVPGALIKPVYDMAKKVAVGDASTLVTRRAKIIAKLNQMEVSTARVLAKLEVTDVENIDLQHLEILIGLGTAIRDGDTSVDEAFPPVSTGGGTAAPKPTEETREQRLKRQMDEQAKQTQPQQTQEAPKQETKANESEPPIHDDGTKPEPTKEIPKDPTPSGLWKDRAAMISAFSDKRVDLTDDEFFGILGNNGIASDEDLQLNSLNTIKAFGELNLLIDEKSQAKQKEAAAPVDLAKKPVFGSRGRKG